MRGEARERATPGSDRVLRAKQEEADTVRKHGRGWMAWAAGLVLAAGCGSGELEGAGASTAVIAQFSLKSDPLGALRLEDCVDSEGKPCTAYPNPAGCEALAVNIGGTGIASGLCAKAGEVFKLGNVLQGLPYLCGFDQATGCVRCQDVLGAPVLERCPPVPPALPGAFSDAGLPTGEIPAGPRPPMMGDGGMPAPAPVPTPVPAPEVPGAGQAGGVEQGPGGAGQAGAAPCDLEAAKAFYADKLNQILAKEGLKFSFTYEAGGDTSSSPLFSMGLDLCGGAAQVAGLALPSNLAGLMNPTACDANAEAQGRCYCYDGMAPTCRCARITNQVLAEICGAVATCADRSFVGQLWPVHNAANRWLNQMRFPPSAGPLTLDTATGPESLVCLGSPLVIDTKGDGIALTSLDQGVAFPLTTGVTRSAWVRGDDALLAMDRNNNGRIDDGSELFGEGSASDGFAALSALDAVSNGGNGNGLVDPGDLLFDQLVLWSDANGDGQSAPSELRSLTQHGIVGLELTAVHHAGLFDAHGNDLGLRARFHRQDGTSGDLVDVLFRTSSK